MIERIDQNQKLKREHTQKIAEYYDKANIFYYLMWHRRTFGLHYGLWLSGVKNRNEAIVKENEYLANLASVCENDLVLDAGCGVGGSSAWLAKNKGARVVGITLSDVQLSGAKRVVSEKKFKFNVADKTEFAKADYQTLPFKDNSFDVVWSLESLEHAVSVESFIKESERVLKHSGRLVIAATLTGKNTPSDEQAKQLQVGLDVAGAFKDSKTGQEIKELMEDAGFGEVFLSDFTKEVMPSAVQMTNMCKWGLPVAKVLNKIVPQYVPREIILNNEWGLYQEKLFESGVTSYNILVGTKE